MIHYRYAQQIWKDAEKNHRISNVWNGNFVEQSLKNWFKKKELKAFGTLPCILLWGIWIICNDNLFNDKQRPTFQVLS